eukprot:TRINITY_DN11030_c0_g1_i3.p1 TRINITY_DN11030_c0_g1~~TRINITY_DN11030_c0_g1_i3.p1  ORF type:complete len:968 (+),score=195.47 TRINITY_DN11030_c0_g1_i3:165-3068(+)
MSRDRDYVNCKTMEDIPEGDVEELSPHSKVVVEHPPVIVESTPAKPPAEELDLTPKKTPSRLVVGLNELTSRVAKEDVQEHAFEPCGILVPTPTLHTTNTETDQTEEDAREIKDELFYDLIFVAAIIKLSDFSKADVSWTRVGETFELFLLLWTTWLHVTFLFSRFTLPSPWKVLEVLLLLGTLGLALHMVEFSSSKYHVPGALLDADNPLDLDDGRHGTNIDVVHAEGTFRIGLSVSVILTRLAIIGVYILTAIFAPKARALSKTYVAGFCLALMLWLTAAVWSSQSEASAAVPTFWGIAMVAELLIYPLAALKEANRISLNIWHVMERQMLWVIVILGESLISIVLPELPCECDTEVYVVIALSLLLVYNIFRSYINVQPDHETGDLHALQGSFLVGWLWCVWLGMATFAAFLLGVGTKLVVIHANDGQYIRSYAWLLCGSFFLIKLFLSLARLCHNWTGPVMLWGVSWGRVILLLVPPMLAAFSLLMPRYVKGRKLPKLKGQKLLGALQRVIDQFSSDPSKASMLDLNAAVVNGAMNELEPADDGLGPVAIVAVLVAMSFVIRWIETYILWLELKTEMQQAGEITDSKRLRHDVFQTKTVRRKHVHDQMSLASGYNQLAASQPLPDLEAHLALPARPNTAEAKLRRPPSITERFGRFAGHEDVTNETFSDLLGRHVSLHRRKSKLQRSISRHGASALLTRARILPVLRTHPMFQHLTMDELQALVRQFQERHVRAGDVITRMGEPSDILFIVGGGVFEMRANLNGHKFPVCELKCESVFGQLAAVGPTPSSSTVVVTSVNGLLWELHRDKLEENDESQTNTPIKPRAVSHSRLDDIYRSAAATESRQSYQPNADGDHAIVHTWRHSSHDVTLHAPHGQNSMSFGQMHASYGSLGSHPASSVSQPSVGGEGLQLRLGNGLKDEKHVISSSSTARTLCEAQSELPPEVVQTNSLAHSLVKVQSSVV